MLLLEMIELRVQSVTINYCARKKRLEHEKEVELEKQIILITRKLEGQDPNISNNLLTIKLNELKEDLQHIRENK